MKKLLSWAITFALIISVMVQPVSASGHPETDIANIDANELTELVASGVDQRSPGAKQSMTINASAQKLSSKARSAGLEEHVSEPQIATLLLDRTEQDGVTQETYMTVAAVDFQSSNTESSSSSKQSMTVYVYITYDYKFEDGYTNAYTRFNKTQHKIVVHSSSLRATALRMEHNAWSRANLDEDSDERTVSNPTSNTMYTLKARTGAAWWYINEATYIASTSGYTSDGAVGFVELEILPGKADLQ